jgi:hypothetical protein
MQKLQVKKITQQSESVTRKRNKREWTKSASRKKIKAPKTREIS